MTKSNDVCTWTSNNFEYFFNKRRNYSNLSQRSRGKQVSAIEPLQRSIQWIVVSSLLSSAAVSRCTMLNFHFPSCIMKMPWPYSFPSCQCLLCFPRHHECYGTLWTLCTQCLFFRGQHLLSSPLLLVCACLLSHVTTSLVPLVSCGASLLLSPLLSNIAVIN